MDGTEVGEDFGHPVWRTCVVEAKICRRCTGMAFLRGGVYLRLRGAGEAIVAIEKGVLKTRSVQSPDHGVKSAGGSAWRTGGELVPRRVPLT